MKNNKMEVLKNVDFINLKVYYVGINNNSFRSNEPAKIIGIYNVKPKGLEERPCYKIKYADNKIDYCPIEDYSNYRIISGNNIIRPSYKLKEK